MAADRLYRLLAKEDLDFLLVMGLQEHERFFHRNPRLRDAYHDNLIAICLCQGAALHYLDPRVGVKDFDVWHFYAENERVPFPYRAHCRVEDGYLGKPVDFLKRAIPWRIVDLNRGNPNEIVRTYLLERNSGTKRRLLQKAVLGLFPERIFGAVLWHPPLARQERGYDS